MKNKLFQRQIDEFNVNHEQGATNECWIWRGKLDSSGYGKVGVGSFIQGAHRVSYRLYKGEITEGKHVRHCCNNPLCVNPEHLSLGTAWENKQDSVKANRHFKNIGETHSQAKLTESDVIKIRGLIADKVAIKIIAREYNVSPSTITAIKLRNNWSHVR